MISEILYFYLLFFLLPLSALGVILAPRMYLSVLSLFLLICCSSLLYFGMNAKYIAVFQFILCGLFLSVYIFLLLKKIGRLNLKLKLVTPFKIIPSVIFTVLFGVLTCLFFNEEFSNALFDIFSFVTIKSSDVVDFASHLFPLHLVVLLVLVSAAVIRVFLISRQNAENIPLPVVSETGEDK